MNDATTCMDGSEFCYRPTALTVSAGTTVDVTNNSMAPHSLTRCTVSACGSGNTGDGTQSFDTGVLSHGSSAQVTLTKPGTYVYYCTVHGYSVMHGSFTVTAASSSATPGSSSSSAPSPSAAPSSPRVTRSAAAGDGVAVPVSGAGVPLGAAAALGALGLATLVVARRLRRR
jgi:plastocyanin